MGKKKRNKSSDSTSDKLLSHFLSKEEAKKKMNQILSSSKLARREKNKFHNSLEGMTKEEKIAANKARIAQYHPEPDFSNITPSPKIAKERLKIKHEKAMLEKAKKIWHSIVSVPMGGMNKK